LLHNKPLLSSCSAAIVNKKKGLNDGGRFVRIHKKKKRRRRTHDHHATTTTTTTTKLSPSSSFACLVVLFVCLLSNRRRQTDGKGRDGFDIKSCIYDDFWWLQTAAAQQHT